MNQKVLLIEDELVLAEIVLESLQSRGFSVSHAATIAEGLNLYYTHSPAVIVLDVMLPDGSGLELARQLRNLGTELPIIFLTSKSLPQDVVDGFESGGNDYLKKPFSLEELIVRIRALLSKSRLITPNPGVNTIPLGQFVFKYPKGVLQMLGNERLLTTREAEILHMLILNKNGVLSRNELLNSLWGDNDYFSGRSLDVFITKLRQYLKEDPSVSILNIRGQGYKLIY